MEVGAEIWIPWTLGDGGCVSCGFCGLSRQNIYGFSKTLGADIGSNVRPGWRMYAVE